jgi:hypothetical protein
VKFAEKAAMFALIFTALASAQTQNQFGSWSVYRPGNQGNNELVLLQTISGEESNDVQGNSAHAKLDIICKRGRIYRVAVEMDRDLRATALDYSGAVLTTRVAFASEGGESQTEKWAVADHGPTLSPYSEVFQGARTRSWVQRFSGARQIVLQVDDGLAQVTFATGELPAALASAGCS